jgi:cysteinyl-tRNA synthetase
MDQNKMTKGQAKEILDFLKQIDEYFGFIFWGREKQQIPAEIKKLAEQREQYRKDQNWAKADEARKQIESLGWMLDDTPSGPKLKKGTKLV